MPRFLITLWFASSALLGFQQSVADDSTKAAFVRVSPRNHRYLELSDGTPYVPIGLNMISPRGDFDTQAGLVIFDHWFGKLAEQGGNFARVWLSSPFWDVEHERCGVFDETKAKRIDALLDLARKHGIRLKLTIEHFREIDPDSDYKPTWALKPLHHVSQGGPAKSMTDWFDGQPARAMYEKKLDWYAARYGNDPTIFGWELWNEINAVRGSGDYMAWSEVMLVELRKRFPPQPRHAELGQLRQRRRPRALPSTGDHAEERPGPGGIATWTWGRNSTCAKVRSTCWRPRRFGNSSPQIPNGLSCWRKVVPSSQNTRGPSNFTTRTRRGSFSMMSLFAPFFAGAAGPGHCWHWAVYIDKNDLWWQFGRFAQAIQGIDPAAENFEPRMIDHDRLRLYALVGKNTTLLWCRDKENTWRSELADGIAPGKVEGAIVNLSGLVQQNTSSVRTYDPWQDEWKKVSITNGTVELPTFARSLVLRIENQK